MMTRAHDDPEVSLTTVAIRTGDLQLLQSLLDENPGLASDEIRGPRGGTGTVLMTTCDWPGYFPNGPEIVRMLVAAGADPSWQPGGSGWREGPLHWAASSDDVDVAEALIDCGAELDAPDGSIGTPLANAVGYGCWHVARLLVARGAKVGSLWEAAALGLWPVVEEMMAADPPPDAGQLNQAFWHACSGGQLRMAAYLLGKGVDINWSPEYAHGNPIDAAAGTGTRRGVLVDWLRERGAVPAESEETPAGDTDEAKNPQD